MTRRDRVITALLLLGSGLVATPEPRAWQASLPVVSGVEAQPVVRQALRLQEALAFLGGALRPEDEERLRSLASARPDESTVRQVQEILDPYCLAFVHINPEARVRVERGPAIAELMQNGWRTFLVKVHNEGQVRSILEVDSPNSAPLFHRSTFAQRLDQEKRISDGEIANRFLELAMYRRRPLQDHLSGLELEYAVLQVYTTQGGRREARIGFHVGQGTQDLGFRNTIDLLFDCRPAVKVRLRVHDHDGSPALASFVITDGIERLLPDPAVQNFPADYRFALARRRPWEADTTGTLIPAHRRLLGIYPLPSRRLARDDEFPDFFFHPQIYRGDGEHVFLPPGNYDVTVSRGPEYLTETRRVSIPEAAEFELEFHLRRWVHMAALGWYSGDHHVHAAGCSHYENPAEGVDPQHMWRQVVGEDLNVASVLNWGPSWYHQKQFFEGRPHPLSTSSHLMRYDVEVSGFPSSHAGHLCLLQMKEDDFPGTTEIDQWPSWTLPILQWAKSQGGVVGYAHSGWGLEPLKPADRLPNFEMPKFDGIGANEYIVTVTHDAVDFISAGDTPPLWELNIWYHTLNSGFRTRISGETDFPCIYDEQVGMARSYVRLEDGLTYEGFVEAVRDGRSYVSDGRSHLIDFQVGEAVLGVNGSELRLERPGRMAIRARATAQLPEEQDEIGAVIASRALHQQPYWHLERSRIAGTRRVKVELVVNGEAVDSREISADGAWNDIEFEHSIGHSSWLALRILPSSHTNPIFVLVGDQPIRASVESAQWCRRSVDRCWEMKAPLIRESERAAAEAAYEHARRLYERIAQEATRR